MKKLLILAALISSLTAGVVQTSFAADAKAELRQKFKDNIKTSENGDVCIATLPQVDLSKAKDTEMVGVLLMTFISYVDPNMDFDELDKSIKVATGGKKSPVPIVSIMAGIGKYLGRNNMQLQKIPFSGSGAIQRLDDGVPIIAWIVYSDIYQKQFLPRTEKRAGVAKAEDWAKELRKLEIKKLPKGKTFTKALVMGYNKTTEEYLVSGVSEKPIWMTEKELKGVMLEAYILRF